MWILVIVVGIVFLLFGVGRAMYKGEYRSFRNFLLTVFLLDLVFDDWGGDSDITDFDF